VEDAEDAEDDEDEAGPNAKNGAGDEDPELSEEDEDGRFFGGGLTSQQRDILNIFDGAGGEGAVQDVSPPLRSQYAWTNRVLIPRYVLSQVEEVSLPGIRRTLLKLERAINKNQDQRSKYPDDPTKFIDSEADLDVAIKALMPLSQAPTLAYPEIVKAGTVTMLVGLLSHENMDIVIDVVEVIRELTDEDVGGEADEDEEGEVDEETGQSKKDLGMKLLIDALVCTF
jgi:beta-catenin-like protein 1